MKNSILHPEKLINFFPIAEMTLSLILIKSFIS